jgi:uncharacterized protein YlxW (UPF0749 family)
LKRTAIEQRCVQTLRSNAQEAQRQLLTEKQTAYAKVRSVSSMTQDLQTLERQLWTSTSYAGEFHRQLHYPPPRSANHLMLQ